MINRAASSLHHVRIKSASKCETTIGDDEVAIEMVHREKKITGSANASPVVAALSVIRGALVKSDNIIKLPSNDPLTATAILETMRDIDSNHPVIKHFSTIYWKGGDQE